MRSVSQSSQGFHLGIDTQELETVSLFLRQCLRGVECQLKQPISCMYTMSLDYHSIVGQYPATPNIHSAAGLSGHEFKFARVLGEAAADMILDILCSLPMGFLKPAQFN